MSERIKKIIIKEQICPQCNGKGRIVDHMFGIFTVGLGYLAQALDDDYQEDCPTCGGSGKIKIKSIKYEE